MARVYNFSAGPSMLPVSVLEKAQSELLEYEKSGQSVMEMSHRSSVYDAIIKDTEAALRRVLSIPDNYRVGFFGGGASMQFDMVPLNLMTTGEADYIVTGQFSKKAASEAKKFGTVHVIASSADDNFTR
ncbi:MAG: aminotransferase class V-fold PLP-dependent enzyme, partial [Oscillospiraceae bacterium]|nr:aminotransferase class V-fold PLP-dependent enzyme [Oscillospiraceae bacterium]